ncbi:protein-tyrosine phosphatase [Azospirillum fermentarium]|uniref:low molecular weight protein-tyrosine-phosphatase n=1 Tax=Azospirillum fermentarium TaxID=1233114 RepID=UPI0022271C02|nr:low molecular weight protein-tyrosine-phosphatase [Azospirillum fermentarium]MCW2245266.1 protein-tyrosine phosphatase [Azospirillum fermentarium]
MVKVLFVCTGNICRSPTAHGVFRAFVREAGLEDRIHTDSAGTSGYHVGDPPDRRSLELARQRGYDLSDLRARRVTVGDFRDFDHILAMDHGHLDALRRMAPRDSTADVRLFLDYAPDWPVREVPDPYYGGALGFVEVLEMVEAASRGLLGRIRQGF